MPIANFRPTLLLPSSQPPLCSPRLGSGLDVGYVGKHFRRQLRKTFVHRSDEEEAEDIGMADLQKSLERVVLGKREQARQDQLALIKVSRSKQPNPPVADLSLCRRLLKLLNL